MHACRAPHWIYTLANTARVGPQIVALRGALGAVVGVVPAQPGLALLQGCRFGRLCGRLAGMSAVLSCSQPV